ncbi:MAG: hypothetical protein H6745_22480 [Deltaproteobacteria bacterium]|nr:hypothetical protein [Deltaproteobacteria bacterium]
MRSTVRAATRLSLFGLLATAGALGACDAESGVDDFTIPFDGLTNESDTFVGGGDTSVAPAQDPCGGVPTTGRCNGASIDFCVVVTGSSEPFATTISCGPGMTCAETGAGATCVNSAECRPGDSECRSGQLASCKGDGHWQLSSCGGGCVDSAIGATCRPSVPTERYANTVEFEFKRPDADFTDWGGDVFRAPARRFLVVSFGNGDVLDSTVTDNDGHFELDVVPAAQSDGDDSITLFAGRVADGGFAYAIVDPGFGAREVSISDLVANGAPDPTFWRWTWTPADIPSGDGAYLSINAGSGVAFAYDYLSWVHNTTQGFFGGRPESTLVMWLGFGTSWNCGACFLKSPTMARGVPFASSVFYPADNDEEYWSGAVLAHELGHWVMSTYGTNPGEGGQHILGIPSHPGLAWSEGFATWFSCVVRGEPFYYDKQDGLFFWVDHKNRAYESGAPWQRPINANGLEQLIDENEVTRMLLGLTSESTWPGMLAALSSARMNVAPFLRGYRRRTWDGLDANGYPLPAWSTTDSAPHLADYFDALVCGGVVSGATIDAQTEPWTFYPYPSGAPLCRRPEAPIEVTWRGDVAEVRWFLRLDGDLTLTLTGAGPATTRTIASGAEPGSVTLSPPAGGAGPLGGAGASGLALEVSLDGATWGVHGRTTREKAPPVAVPPRLGAVVGLKGMKPTAGIALHRVPPEARAPRGELPWAERLGTFRERSR